MPMPIYQYHGPGTAQKKVLEPEDGTRRRSKIKVRHITGLLGSLFGNKSLCRKISISADYLPDPAILMNDDPAEEKTKRSHQPHFFHLAARPGGGGGARKKKKGCIQQAEKGTLAISLRAAAAAPQSRSACPWPAIPGSAHQAMKDSDKVPACSHKFSITANDSTETGCPRGSVIGPGGCRQGPR